MHSGGSFGLWSEAWVSHVAFPTVQSLWLVFNRQKSKVAAVLKWPIHYIVVMQCLLSTETSVCFAPKHFILLHRFASFFPCPIVELDPVPWQQLLSTKVCWRLPHCTGACLWLVSQKGCVSCQLFAVTLGKKKKKKHHRETLSTASNSGDPSLFPRPLQTCAIKEGRLWPPLVAHHLASVMLKNAGTAYCNPTKHFWEGRRTKSSCGWSLLWMSFSVAGRQRYWLPGCREMSFREQEELVHSSPLGKC